MFSALVLQRSPRVLVIMTKFYIELLVGYALWSVYTSDLGSSTTVGIFKAINKLLPYHFNTVISVILSSNFLLQLDNIFSNH